MLSQLSYFPTWTPQRGVARYVCHSSAAVKSFLCTGRPSVRREGPDIRGMQGHARAGQLRIRLRQAGGHACTSDRQDGDVVMFAARSGCFQAFSPWYAGRQAPAFPECLRESMAAPKQAGTATPCPSGHRGIPGPCLPAGNPHATPDKARGIPGSSPSAIPEKNRPGRPCGAWLPRKKTL